MSHKKNKTNQSLQIMAGELRRRHISFVETEQLRPTGARIRETLFNWLQPEIANTSCLDLFAGSGILGIEAFSRGAKHVTFVEKNQITAKTIQQNLAQLNIDNATVFTGDYQLALTKHYDIIFLDPPYNLRLLPKLLDEITALTPSWVFIEDDHPLCWVQDLTNYRLQKYKKAGNIYYGLLSSS